MFGSVKHHLTVSNQITYVWPFLQQQQQKRSNNAVLLLIIFSNKKKEKKRTEKIQKKNLV